jgi:hypothetical protein
MAANLTRLSHKSAIQLHLVTERCTICSFRSRRPVLKLLDTPSYMGCISGETPKRSSLVTSLGHFTLRGLGHGQTLSEEDVCILFQNVQNHRRVFSRFRQLVLAVSTLYKPTASLHYHNDFLELLLPLGTKADNPLDTIRGIHCCCCLFIPLSLRTERRAPTVPRHPRLPSRIRT